MKTFQSIQLLMLLLFVSPQTISAGFDLHHMYGFWDTQPMPEAYRHLQAQNAKALGANSIMHDKADTLNLIAQFSQEYDPTFWDLFNKIPRKVSQADLGRYTRRGLF